MSDSAVFNAPTWSVVVISSRESAPVLLASLGAVARACEQPARIDVVVNGNRPLADEAAAALRRWNEASSMHQWHVWHIALSDKANAINQYVHCICAAGETVFFVDGYVRVRPDAFSLLNKALSRQPQALAAAALPTVGRSASALARELVEQSGIHGNLFALRRCAAQQMAALGFRLPIGLYRTDSTIGSALAFGLDPTRNEWNPKTFIAVARAATWNISAARWWHPGDWLSQWKRRSRQSRGDIENWAVRNVFLVNRHSIDRLQPDVGSLVREWVRNDQAGANERVKSHPRRKTALRALLAIEVAHTPHDLTALLLL